MKNKPSIVFFGNERIATGLTKSDLPTLNSLIGSGYKIDAIFSPYKKITSRKVRHLEVFKFAKQHNISIYTEYSNNELQNILDKLPAKIGILVAYGKIVPQSIIDHFEYGIVNIHPSLLPKYRGSTPIETAILDGAKTTGVSIMQLTSEMDAGPVFLQEDLELKVDESKERLAHDLNLMGAKLLVENLDLILSNKLKPSKQNGSETNCTKISKYDGDINTDLPAYQILREVRAYSGWPKSHLYYKDVDIIILEARLSNTQATKSALEAVDGKLILGCKDSSVEIISLQVTGKKPMNANSFINGYKNILSL